MIRGERAAGERQASSMQGRLRLLRCRGGAAVLDERPDDVRPAMDL